MQRHFEALQPPPMDRASWQCSQAQAQLQIRSSSKPAQSDRRCSCLMSPIHQLSYMCCEGDNSMSCRRLLERYQGRSLDMALKNCKGPSSFFVPNVRGSSPWYSTYSSTGGLAYMLQGGIFIFAVLYHGDATTLLAKTTRIGWRTKCIAQKGKGKKPTSLLRAPFSTHLILNYRMYLCITCRRPDAEPFRGHRYMSTKEESDGFVRSHPIRQIRSRRR
ncbi:hypothetical protein F4801DRAFT_469191 [Xylaria longipes]|nr:hypothetical protein F4801DRAFT_469191 [Xylaria longipes]